MRNIFFTLFLFHFFISCGHKLNSKVENAVNVLSAENLIHLDSFWAKKNESYINLLKVSTIEDLIYLTDSENAYVIYYAYLGLTEKNYPKIKEIYFKHKNDIKSVNTTNGACIKGSMNINRLMLYELNPNDSENKYSFTQNEYDKEYSDVTD